MSNSSESLNGAKFDLSAERALSIGKVTEAVTRQIGKRCTSAMIYNYERLGLIPRPRRSEGGFRLYRPEIVGRIVLIKQLQEEGLSLEEIKQRLDEDAAFLKDDALAINLPTDRREQILKAAANVFPQKGYMETSMQDIAQEAGISSSAIYLYFNGKEELFLAMTESLSFMNVMEEVTSSLEHKEDIQAEDVREALIAVGSTYMNIHRANAEVVRLLFSESKRFPEIGIRYCDRLIGPLETQFERYLSFLIQRGIFRRVNVKNATFAFFGMFLSYVATISLLYGSKWLTYPEGDDLAMLIDLFLSGMLRK